MSPPDHWRGWTPGPHPASSLRAGPDQVPVEDRLGPVVAHEAPTDPVLRRRSDPPTRFIPLTAREIECLARYPFAGGTWKQVADQMGISPMTVRNLMGNAYWKLGARNITEAYVRMGWLRVPPR